MNRDMVLAILIWLVLAALSIVGIEWLDLSRETSMVLAALASFLSFILAMRLTLEELRGDTNGE